ncbi:hypothetical protein [Paenibacillus sp. GM2]|uniref:hypothetical protein n=1 Tax=Paenibacillus sp. GM2 TaxID=1622070 RepID=UPI000839BEF1|nr:hypothetical protein [Paenibacillus sp. GM2]
MSLTNKGVAASVNDTPAQLAIKIGQINTGKKYLYRSGVGQSAYVNFDFGFEASILLIKAPGTQYVAFDNNGFTTYGGGAGLSNIQYGNIKWSNGKMAGIQNYLIGDKVSYTIEAWE